MTQHRTAERDSAPGGEPGLIRSMGRDVLFTASWGTLLFMLAVQLLLIGLLL